MKTDIHIWPARVLSALTGEEYLVFADQVMRLHRKEREYVDGLGWLETDLVIPVTDPPIPWACPETK